MKNDYDPMHTVIWTVLFLLLATLVCWLVGCSITEAEYKIDGTVKVKRTRVLMKEDIDSFSYDASDGSFTLDGYRSDMTRMIDLVDRLTKKDDERKLAAKSGGGR